MIDNRLFVVVGLGWGLESLRAVEEDEAGVKSEDSGTTCGEAPLLPAFGTQALPLPGSAQGAFLQPLDLLPKGWSDPSHPLRQAADPSWPWLQLESQSHGLNGGKSFPAGSGRQPRASR